MIMANPLRCIPGEKYWRNSPKGTKERRGAGTKKDASDKKSEKEKKGVRGCSHRDEFSHTFPPNRTDLHTHACVKGVRVHCAFPKQAYGV